MKKTTNKEIAESKWISVKDSKPDFEKPCFLKIAKNDAIDGGNAEVLIGKRTREDVNGSTYELFTNDMFKTAATSFKVVEFWQYVEIPE